MSCPNGLPGQLSFTQYFHRGGAYFPPCVLSSIFWHSNTAPLAAQKRRRGADPGVQYSFRRPTYDAVSIIWMLHIWTAAFEMADYAATTDGYHSFDHGVRMSVFIRPGIPKQESRSGCGSPEIARGALERRRAQFRSATSNPGG
jgi:hypothetical protein